MKKILLCALLSFQSPTLYSFNSSSLPPLSPQEKKDNKSYPMVTKEEFASPDFPWKKIVARTLVKTIALHNSFLALQYAVSDKKDFAQVPFKEFLLFPFFAPLHPLFWLLYKEAWLIEKIVSLFSTYTIKGRYEHWASVDPSIEDEIFIELYNSDPEHYRLNRHQREHLEFILPQCNLDEQNLTMTTCLPPGLQKFLTQYYFRNSKRSFFTLFIIIFAYEYASAKKAFEENRPY